MKLSTSDYKKILKFYKLSIPKKSKNIKKKADKIIAKKFCSCIKKVQQKFKKEGIAIGICTKSVITRKGYKRGKFRCKKRRTIKLQKGGRRKTRKKRGGDLELKQIHVNDLNQDAVGKYFKFTTRSNTGVIKVFDGKFLGYRLDRGILKAIFRIIKPRGELYVRLGQFVEIFKYVAETDTDNHTLEFIFANPQQGGRRKKKTRKKRGGTANLCKLFYEKNNGRMPTDGKPAVIDKYCKDHGDTNVVKHDNNICNVTTGKCSGPVPVTVAPRTSATGETKTRDTLPPATSGSIAPLSMRSAREQRQRVHTVLPEDNNFDSQFGGKRRKKTRKKKGSMKKAKADTSIEAVRERLKKVALNINKTKQNIQSSSYKQKLRTSPIISLKKGSLTKEEEALQNEMNRVSPIDSNLIYKPLIKFTKKPVKIESKKSKGGKRRRRTRKKK